MQVTPTVAVIAESVAHTFNTGVSFAPLPAKPFIVTLIGSNLTRYSDSYASFTATFAYAGNI